MYACSHFSMRQWMGIKGHNHVPRIIFIRICLYISVNIGIQIRAGERHPEVTIFDHFIDFANHVRISGVSENGSISEGSSTKFFSSFKSCYDMTGSEKFSRCILNIFLLADAYLLFESIGLKRLFDFLV
jgi:hypothetical protein